MSINSCPCCSTSMLLHLSNRRSYWLCSHCRLEIPNSVSQSNGKQSKTQSKTISLTSFPLKAEITPLKSEQSIIAV
ncbi:MAG: hypothetical protein WBM86_14380 [Waterburya sp.]